MDANVNHKGTESPTAVASSKDVSGTGQNSLGASLHPHSSPLPIPKLPLSSFLFPFLLPLPLPPSSFLLPFLLPLPPSPSSFPFLLPPLPPPPSLPPDVLGPLLVSILTQNIEKGVDNALNGMRDKASSMGSSASAMSDPMTSSIEASAEGADPMATGARRTGAALDVSGLPPGCWDSTDEFVPARLPAPRWGMGLAVPSELAVHESNGC